MLNIWGSFPLSLYILISFYLIQTFPIYKTIMVPYMYYQFIYVLSGLPWWLGGKESACQFRTHGFDPWVGKIPWRREWQQTPVFLPRKSQGQRRLAGYSPWGHKKSDMTATNTYTHTHIYTHTEAVVWRRKWQPIPILLPGESHGQRSLGGLKSMGSQIDTTEWITHTQKHTHRNTHTYTHTVTSIHD